MACLKSHSLPRLLHEPNRSLESLQHYMLWLCPDMLFLTPVYPVRHGLQRGSWQDSLTAIFHGACTRRILALGDTGLLLGSGSFTWCKGVGVGMRISRCVSQRSPRGQTQRAGPLHRSHDLVNNLTLLASVLPPHILLLKVQSGQLPWLHTAVTSEWLCFRNLLVRQGNTPRASPPIRPQPGK